MKINHVSDKHVLLAEIAMRVSPGAVDIDNNSYDEIGKAYEELEVLEGALATGNFGVLIGKAPDQLRVSDIIPIKNKLLQITEENMFFQGNSFKGRNASNNFDLMARIVGHGIESVFLATITAAFGGLAVSQALTGNELIAALAGTGVLAGGYGLHVQVRSIKALWAAYRLSRILSAYNDYNAYNPKTYQVSLWHQFLNWIEGKTVEQVRQEVIRKIQTEATKKQMKFEHEIRNLPKYMTVKGEDGVEEKYPIASLFDFE